MQQACFSKPKFLKANLLLWLMLLGWCFPSVVDAQSLQTIPTHSQPNQILIPQTTVSPTAKAVSPRQVLVTSPWQPAVPRGNSVIPQTPLIQNSPLNYTPLNVVPVQYRSPAANTVTNSLVTNRIAPQSPAWFGHSAAKPIPENSNGYFNSAGVTSNPLPAPNPRLAQQVNQSLYKQTQPTSPFNVSGNSSSMSQPLAPFNQQTNFATRANSNQAKPKKKEYSTKLEKGTFTEFSVHAPQHDANARSIPFTSLPFVSDPDYSHVPFMPEVDASPYTGKYLNPTQRPWVEFGRGLYRYGEIPESSTLFGETNLLSPSFLVYGDYRAGMAYVKNNADKAVAAHRLNLDFDLKLTDTERIHAFWGPLDRNGRFNRIEFDDGEFEYIEEYDDNFDTIFFEGDLGSIYGGLVGEDAPFDMPIALGYIPLLFQNGIWMEDAFLGAAVTIPAQNSRLLDWVNYDLTFFAGFNDLTSPALRNTGDGQAHLYGATAMIDAYDGYVEAGYAYIDHRTTGNLSYHNMSLSYTRRYKDKVSSAVRLIVNAGQDPDAGPQTADGQMILWENAFITSQPLTFVPYANFFVGFDRTQSVARAGGAGGILRNTGINFETDGLTGYPTLDATGQNTYGGAIGVNWMGKKLDYQLIVELATVQTMGARRNLIAAGDQYALGARYQVPLNNAWLFRADVMHGILDNSDDISGVRTELRWKF